MAFYEGGHSLLCSDECVQHIHRMTTSEDGEYLILQAEHGRDWTDWPQCGSVAPPDTPCTAWSEAAANQCPKRAAVMIDVGGYVPVHVALCGGHLDVHRRRDMRVEWT